MTENISKTELIPSTMLQSPSSKHKKKTKRVSAFTTDSKLVDGVLENNAKMNMVQKIWWSRLDTAMPILSNIQRGQAHLAQLRGMLS